MKNKYCFVLNETIVTDVILVMLPPIIIFFFLFIHFEYVTSNEMRFTLPLKWNILFRWQNVKNRMIERFIYSVRLLYNSAHLACVNYRKHNFQYSGNTESNWTFRVIFWIFKTFMRMRKHCKFNIIYDFTLKFTFFCFSNLFYWKSRETTVFHIEF